LDSSIRRNLALEGSQRWFRGYGIARSEFRGQVHVRTRRLRTHPPRVRKAIGNTGQPLVVRETILMRLDAGLASGEPVRVQVGRFANFLHGLERLDKAGRLRLLLVGTAVPVTFHRFALSLAA
jgi:hypothetical protein